MRGDEVLYLSDLVEAKIHFGDQIDLNVSALRATRWRQWKWCCSQLGTSRRKSG
jgi:hypothetical protein